MLKNTFRSKTGASLLIFIAWLIYTISYLGKVNYSANITQIISYYNISKAEAGAVPSFFFFAYGIGQVINGILCKRYNIKWTIFISLITSALINLIIAISSNFAIIKWLWMINGFVLSILWPSLIRLLAESLPIYDLGKSSVIMGTTVALGTLVIYGLSSIFVYFDKFKLAFYTAAISDLSVSIIWILLYKKAVNSAKSERDTELPEDTKSESQQISNDNAQNKKLFYISICILCFCAIGVNLIKDGLTTWVPSILKDEFSIPDSLSILLTLLLPILAIFGNLIALKTHKKIPDYITHCFIIFGVIALFILLIIQSISFKTIILALFGLVAANFFASSLNSLISTIYPMFMREKINSGLIAGILNGFCYIGSTISSYGLGYIADSLGWTAVFWTLIIFCASVSIIWGIYKYLKHIIKKS